MSAQAQAQTPKYTLKELREEKGWSKQHLAIRLGVTYVTINNWETLKNRPDQYFVEQFEGLFGVPADFIEMKPVSRRQRGTDYGLDLLELNK